MSHIRVGFAGLDRAEEEDIRSIFARANQAAGDSFTEADEADAEILLVDVDTIHGHMTWMRVHNDPDRTVIALSARDMPHAEHGLLRPLTVDSLRDVLVEIAAQATPFPDTAAAASTADPAAPESGSEADPSPHQADDTSAGRESEPAVAVAADPEPEAPALAEIEAPPAPPAPKRLADYLRPGALPGPSRLAFQGAPELIVDPGAQAYLGPAQLKGFAPYAQAERIEPGQWQPVSASELGEGAAHHGSVQPWARLAWLAGLYGSPGVLAGGFGLEDRFRLTRWPQIEREFPRHFRIATVMMKGPATVDAIAEAAGTPVEEVIDFVNASLAAGQAEHVPDEPVAEEPAPRAGLLDRLKGLRGN